MLTFNLKKEWFEKIKSGEKTHEYRVMKGYWRRRLFQTAIDNYFASHENDSDWTTFHQEIINSPLLFKLGYPKNSETDKIIQAKITKLTILPTGINTDLKINAPVYDIEFELIK